MRPIVVTAGPYSAASANNLVVSVTPTAGTALTLVTTTVDATATARRIVVTAGSEGAPRTLVVTGTGWDGNPRTETISIPSASAGVYGSQLDYQTVTSIVPGQSFTAAITVGTIATGTGSAPNVGSSTWCRFDDYGFGQVALQADVTLAGGTITYSVETTLDDPNVLTPGGITTGTARIAPASMVWIADPNITAATTSKQDAIVARPVFARVTVTAYTGNALVTATFSQAGGKLG